MSSTQWNQMNAVPFAPRPKPADTENCLIKQDIAVSNYPYTFKRLGELEKQLITEKRAEYCRILAEASEISKRALLTCNDFFEFYSYVYGPQAANGFYGDVCMALYDGGNVNKHVNKLIEINFSDVLNKVFPYPEEENG